MPINEKYQPADYDIVVLYHAGCPDGLASAWVFTQFARTDIYYQYVHRDYNIDHLPDLTDKHVYIVDFCYPVDILQDIRHDAASLTILDHHISELKIDAVATVIDPTRCAAEIVWDYLFPAAKQPWWFIHIRDKDLWEWSHQHSRAFSAAMSGMELSFETLDSIHNMNSAARHKFIRSGYVALEFQAKEIVALCNFAEYVNFEGYRVYAVNALRYRNEVGESLAAMPNCDFVLLYRYVIRLDVWIVSLRGTGKVNLCEIAQKYNGGGHICAAAFSCHDISKILRP